MSENRQHPRKIVEIPVSFQLAPDAPRIAGVCRDASLGGMFIETSTPVPYGAEIVVHVKLPGVAAEAKIASTVRWTTPKGMGVQFASMGARETHALVELVK